MHGNYLQETNRHKTAILNMAMDANVLLKQFLSLSRRRKSVCFCERMAM